MVSEASQTPKASRCLDYGKQIPKRRNEGSTHQWICVVGKKRWQVSEQTIFDDNPFLDGFFEWMDSPEGERATEVLDTLLDLMAECHGARKESRLWCAAWGHLALY